MLSFGGQVKQYQVNLYPNRLLSYNLTQQDVMDALARNNNNAGGWYLDRGPEQLVIRGAGWLASGAEALTQIKQIPLTTEDSGIVTIGDVAAVELGAEIRQGAVTMSVRDENGSVASRGEVVSGVVLKRMGANTNATIEGINARIDLIQQALPKGVHFEPYYDRSGGADKTSGQYCGAGAVAGLCVYCHCACAIFNECPCYFVGIAVDSGVDWVSAVGT